MTFRDLPAFGSGILFAVVLLFYWRWSSGRKLRKRFPDVMQPWCRLDRRTRRALTTAVREGHTVPVEHAAIVIEMIDLSAEVERERRPSMWPRVIRGYAFYLAGLMLGVFLLTRSNHGPFPFFLLSYFGTFLVWITRGGVLYRRRIRTWPVNRAVTRAEAERQLAMTVSEG